MNPLKKRIGVNNTRNTPAHRWKSRISGPLTVLVTAFLVSACASVGPDYAPPETKAPAAWNTNLANGLTAGTPDPQTLTHWWTTLSDPVLSDVIGQAVSGNLDVKTAHSRIREVRARRGIATASRFPSLDATSEYRRARTSGSGMGIVDENDLYAVGFDAAWEIDVFGGTRRSVEAADADLNAAGENLHDVLVTLLAETAVNYLDLRTFQTRLTAAESNLDLQKQTYELTQYRYQAGLIDELAVSQASYNLETTRAQIPTLRSGLSEAMNRLAVLTGQPPGVLNKTLIKRLPIPVTPPTVAVGVPAEALRQRPDVRKSERALAAQTARIGEAVADLYPKLTLTGTIGLESVSSGDLLNAGSRVWRYGPGVSWQVFDAGAIRQNIKVQSALQEQALIQYESTVLTALEETENALNAFAEEQQRREALTRAVSAATQAAGLAEDKFSAGLSDFSTVLEAQRSLVSLQDQLGQSDGAVTSNLIRIYKALGGGWTNQKLNDE
ncbi:MAG: efflux transporter outer membrane subunit [Desulfosalsimonadaceae bacterium]